jgi:hypothetical protein
MTMVEKVTQAIEAAWIECENAREAGFDQPEVLARAAIAAMREPTDKMIDSVMVTAWGGMNNRDEIKRDWAKMIDAALGEK